MILEVKNTSKKELLKALEDYHFTFSQMFYELDASDKMDIYELECYDKMEKLIKEIREA